jgi:sulfite reductase (ferredoxin)
LIFADVAKTDIPRIEEILKRHGVPLSHEISNARRWSMACPALPTCGLAITESERVLPGMVEHLEEELELMGLEDEVFTMRMTGCPNGCARPYNCDIGLVGKTAGKYTIYLGGRVFGDRLNVIYKDLVPAEEVISSLLDVFKYFKNDRQSGESFGDFCHRKGIEDLLAHAEAN